MAKHCKRTASIDFITFSLLQVTATTASIEYALPFAHQASRQQDYVIQGFPILRWASGEMWNEANVWLGAQAQNIPVKDTSIKTVRSIAYSLLTFMRFIEREGLPWNYLPIVTAERAINRYRKFLIDARSDGKLMPATASSKMSVLLRFYRWAQMNSVIGDAAFEVTNSKLVKIADRCGRDMAMKISFSNLSIKNRRVLKDRVEGGLMPVSMEYKNHILEFAYSYLSIELYYMLRIAFESGLRIDSICDLKVETLSKARADYYVPSLCWLPVGPGVSGAPVATKYGVAGEVMISADLVRELKDYCKSVRRLKRESRCSESSRALIFITSHGRSYGRNEQRDGSSINALVYHAKLKAKAVGLNFDDFHFHRARATFGVNIVQCGLECVPEIPLTAVIAFTRDCLLHKNIENTMTYVRFAQNGAIKSNVANEYTKLFMGNFCGSYS